MVPIASFAGWTILTIALIGAGYTLGAAIVAHRLRSSSPMGTRLLLPAVTILKPLHGSDSELEAALMSLLQQEYPAPVQIIFGARDPADTALPIVEKIRKAFPARDISVVVNSRLHGANNKISNLVNMMRLVKHDLLIVADSDIAVPSGYLRTVAADLQKPSVGVVCCLYEGAGTKNLWSRLEAMGINYHFLPNAEFGIVAGLAKPCFGCSIAIRRTMLDQIGGFAAFADCLAEDYEIGRAIRDKGYDISYAPVLVTHNCSEDSVATLVRHELRWSRTTRSIALAGYLGSIITYPFPLGLIAAGLLHFSAVACTCLLLLLGARLYLKRRIDGVTGISAGPAWLLPARDVLSFGIFVASLFGHVVEWQGTRFRIGAGGVVTQF